MSAPVVLRARVWGGDPNATSKLAARLGPLGVNTGQVGQQVAKLTDGHKGCRVSVQITIVDRQPTVEIVPTTSTLIIHALQEPVRDRKKTKNIKHSGSLTLDTVIDIAKQVRHKSMSRTLGGTVKEVLGTMEAMGARCDGDASRDIQRKITSGEIPIPE